MFTVVSLAGCKGKDTGANPAARTAGQIDFQGRKGGRESTSDVKTSVLDDRDLTTPDGAYYEDWKLAIDDNSMTVLARINQRISPDTASGPAALQIQVMQGDRVVVEGTAIPVKDQVRLVFTNPQGQPGGPHRLRVRTKGPGAQSVGYLLTVKNGNFPDAQ
ncbi:MAG: hypothetical protein EOO75_03170 [Myxococcales bacterium]|nr:MAG: hypothetical protein EOO75_03170 [Myxococcales bacterium]